MSKYEEENKSLDDADAVKRSAKDSPEPIIWGDSSEYKIIDLEANDNQSLKDLIVAGATIEELLRRGYTKKQLIALGIISDSGSATLFGADDSVSKTETGSAFSGDPMSDPSLRKQVEMSPAFGPQNMPNSGLTPRPGKAAVKSQAIKYLKNHNITPSIPVPGVTNTYSPFASMTSGPRPTYSGGANSSNNDEGK